MTSRKQQKLQQLRDKYVELLPGKLDTLHRLWHKASLENNITALNQLRQLAHNMAGSAGTFGFPAISAEARILEHTLRHLTDDQPLSTEVKENIADALQRITNLSELGPDELRSNDSLIKAIRPNSTFGSERLIYIVEDDEVLAHEIATQLSYFDYIVKVYRDTSHAIKALEHKAPSAMVIDIELPEGDMAGTMFATVLDEFTSAHIPTIFITARDDWEARLAAVRGNGDAYITKPIVFNDLLERLDILTSLQAPDPVRVMIVEDMHELAEHYKLVLEDSGMQIDIVNNIADLLEKLSDFRPEIILMDLYMPQCSGLEAAAMIRQKDELLSIPIVFLSTESDPLKHLNAIELGADDFLQKPIEDRQLISAVYARAQRFRLLRSHMHRDGLTGLLDHATIKTRLISELSRAHRQSEPLCFVMLDIDHFKNINDTYGHPAGDRVIKNIARLLTSRLRKSDIIGRYGGEEFAVILPDTDIKTARVLLNSVREDFSQILHQDKDKQFSCTFSAGIAQLESGCDIDRLISNADSALYEAKHAGRNNVCIKYQ